MDIYSRCIGIRLEIADVTSRLQIRRVPRDSPIALDVYIPLCLLYHSRDLQVMLWSRSPLPRSVCSSRYLRNPLRIVVHLDSIPLPEPPVLSRGPRTLLKHWLPPQTDRTRRGKMAPKQATLGYVKSGQQTLGCGSLHRSLRRTIDAD